MGVVGLHKLLKPLTKQIKIPKGNIKVAVDATLVLHKCLLRSAVQHARGKPHAAWLFAFYQYFKELTARGLVVHLIFDGAPSKAKQAVHDKVSRMNYAFQCSITYVIIH